MRIFNQSYRLLLLICITDTPLHQTLKRCVIFYEKQSTLVLTLNTMGKFTEVNYVRFNEKRV